MSDDHVPANPEAYLPTVTGFKDAKVDVADPRYHAARTAAFKAGLSQGQFSQMLGFEASRVVDSQSKADPAKPAAVAPAERKTIPGYEKMTMSEKLAAAGHL